LKKKKAMVGRPPKIVLVKPGGKEGNLGSRNLRNRKWVDKVAEEKGLHGE